MKLTGFRSPTVTLTAAVFIAAACTPAASSAPTSGPSAPAGATQAASQAPADVLTGRTVRWALPSAPDFGNVTIPLLKKAFSARGATFEATNFNTQAEANNALLTGQADFEQTQINSIVIAHAVGTDFQALFAVKANEWSLVTPVEITTPEGLNGKKIGIHGPGTLTELLVNSTIKKYNLKPEVLVVPGSDARAAALQAGELDATPADIGTVIGIEAASPGKYHVMIDYNDELPFLGSVVATRKQLIDEDPAFIQAVVDVFVDVQTSIKDNPDQLDAAAAEYLPDLPAADVAARKAAYVGRDYWNPAMDAARVSAALQFMIDTGALAADAAPAVEDISNVSFLAKALGG